MLMKANDILGLNVMSLDTAKKIEDVDDVIFDPFEHKITALLVDKGGLFASAKVLLFEDIKSIGKDAVMIQNEGVLRKVSDIDKKTSHIAKDDTYLTKTKIMTEDGTELGHVTDILFEPTTGVVEELEVSQGLRDISSGKKHIKVSDIITIGEDATIVKNHTQAAFEEQADQQGVHGMIHQGKEKTQEAINTTKDRISDSNTKNQLQDKTYQAKEELASAAQTAGSKLDEWADKAKLKYEEVKNDPENQQKMEDMKLKLKETGDKIKAKTSELTDKSKEKTQEVSNNIEEQRKKEAVGQYLTVNVMSPSDELLGKRGDVITNELIREAERYGIAQKVLGNTSKKPIL
jgi:uncharacterized protein YrrD